LEQLDEVFEEIRELMSRSTIKAVNMRKLDRKEPAQATWMMQQEQQSRGAERQIQGKVWDPCGFQ
jgi:hypothetical protein